MLGWKLLLNEQYGPVYQGEGPRTGQRAWFLRTAGCNLDCSWCDTPYSWDWKRYNRTDEVHPTMVDDLVADWLEMFATPRPEQGLVITGGEPMVQQRALTNLLRHTKHLFRWVQVETNGTIAPHHETTDVVDDWVLSVKLANSGVTKPRRVKWEVLNQFSKVSNVHLKPVVVGPRDLAEILELQHTLGIPEDRVWVMPEGADRTDHLQRARLLEPKIIDTGWNVTLRQHVILHNQERQV